MIRTLATALVVVALAGAAAAAEPPKPPTEAAKAEAARLIAEAKAEDLFEDASEGDRPGARHLRSGLVCRFEQGAELNRIMIFGGSAPRGDDVGCNVPTGDVGRTLYATRHPGDPSIREVMDGAVAAIVERWRDAKPYAGVAADAETDLSKAPRPIAERLRARYVITVDGQAMLTKVDLARFGPWMIKQRTTGPVLGAATDLTSELLFTAVLISLSEMPPDAAPAE